MLSTPTANPDDRTKNYPYDGADAPLKEGATMALLALSHTAVEHQLYEAMRYEASGKDGQVVAFSLSRLLTLANLGSFSTVRRGLLGLVRKQSIEVEKIVVAAGNGRQQDLYRLFSPEEIFARRRAAGIAPYPQEIQHCRNNSAFSAAMESVVVRHDLTRREAQVALCCAQGLTNAEIGRRLFITEQTVKFHLRHIFIKFGVKRRTELISRLLT
jgi:DNA-binding CsgD family transcriptional regulator